MNQRYCLIPEGGINITPNGTITPCCILSKDEQGFGHISKDKLQDIFYGKEYSDFRERHRSGDLPKVCIENCIQRGTNFVHINVRNGIIRRAELAGYKPKDRAQLVTVDMGLGNICTLSCTFCNEDFSSSWAKLKSKSFKIHSFDKPTTLRVVEDLKGITYLSLKGGEPFNIPYLESFLEQLLIQSPNCILDIVTNATEISDRILQILGKFPQVIVTVSIESIDPLYSYLRGGKYTWSHVLKNIERLYSIGIRDINISSLILFYNHRTWAEHMLQIYQDIKKFHKGPLGISAQLCLGPKAQSLFLLDQQKRQALVDNIRYYHNKGLEIGGLENMLTAIITPRPLLDVSRQKIIEQINFNDKRRGMELFNLVGPILEDIDTGYN